MKATISLDGILSLIHAFSLDADSKRWLAEKLVEETQPEKAKQNYADFINSICGAWDDDPRTTEEIKTDIRNARQFNVTRHIMPLTDEKE